jgi:uncharacterized membrane protein
MNEPILLDDRVVTGILFLTIAVVFYTSTRKHPFWTKFYTVFPALLMCYLIPALLNSFNIISSDISKTYQFAKDFALPTALILLTLSIDIKGILNLGSKSIIMFLTGTLGVILGGPLAILLFQWISPEVVSGFGDEATWRGLSTIAGSWIGGGANQAAMLEIYHFDQTKYGAMVLVDIVVANIWMAVLLYGIGKSEKIDKWLKADTTAIDELKAKVSKIQNESSKIPSTNDLFYILGLGFGGTALAHYLSSYIVEAMNSSDFFKTSVINSHFFWVVVLSTTIGLIFSFTKAKQLEGAGASKIGTVCIFFLVTTIGMKMNVFEIFKYPGLFFVGLVWMAFHVGLMFLVAKIIRAPYFFIAVGSKANIGGAASAPIVASAFHSSLATVGVLLAVLGYALGTYGAIFCAELMAWIAN